ncbi:6563_t:CDS:2 [Ambispora gerdemannii]|uniref:6563_t:CDS:1 n=1 Tax=Ambispora gerdemannii TaxID=144530 RepID=A0A9N8VY04_9GLOM|nr:6563_t:CDS:2 [Ambispora gerdemannii]
MSKAQALILGQIKHANETLAELKDRHIIFEFNGTRQEFILTAYESYENISALLCNPTESINKLDKEILELLPTNVSLILVIGDARKFVDIEAATALGITVSDTNSTLLGASTQEEIEKKSIEILDETLFTGIPTNPINDPEVVAENTAKRVTELIGSLGAFEEFDVADALAG